MSVFATGIFTNNDLSECLDVYSGLNECFIEHCKTCKKEYHDDCWEDQPDDPEWFGYIYNEDKEELEEDKAASFKAVRRENTYQVCNSKYLIVGCVTAFRGCYPGYQAYMDTDNIGGVTAYSFPPEELTEDIRPLVITLDEYNHGMKAVAVFDKADDMKILSYEELKELFVSKFGDDIYPHAPSAVYAAMLVFNGTFQSYAIQTYSLDKRSSMPEGTRAMLHILDNIPELHTKGEGVFYDEAIDKINSTVLTEYDWSQSGRRMIKLAFNLYNGYRDSDEYDLYWLTRGLDSFSRKVVREAICIFLS